MKIRSRWLTWIAAATVVSLMKLLFASCRKIYVGVDLQKRLDYIPSHEPTQYFVVCVWHDSLLIPTFAAPRGLRERTCALVSQHQDGSYLAKAMTLLGYRTIRGSSRRGGVQALKQLLEETENMHIVFTPDGPIGPRRQIKQGCVFVASELRRRILPGAFVATRAWHPQGKWTDLLIPMPFSTIYVVTGEPILVPESLTRDQITELISRVQHSMNTLNEEAENRLTRLGVPKSKVRTRTAA